jgi:hypothetical protein
VLLGVRNDVTVPLWIIQPPSAIGMHDGAGV